MVRVLGKIRELLTPAERKTATILLGLMLVGMAFETLGVGLIIPAIVLLTRSDIAVQYPVVAPLIEWLDYPSHGALIAGAMLGLVSVYVFKALFLGFLAWYQTRFAFRIQASMSDRLFAIYLRQPYTFHLQRNSAQLIRNVISEVSVFTSNLLAAMTLLTESLVLFGICGLLLFVEPLGTVVVVSTLGAASWGFHYFTGTRIARWGAARQYHEGLRLQYMQEGLGGAKDVKLLGRETEFLNQYAIHNARTAQVLQRQVLMQQVPRLWLELLAVIGLAILVLSMVSQGRALEAVVPTLGVFAAAAFRLMPSTNRMLGAVQTLRYGLPVVDVLHTELQLVVPSPVTTSRSRTEFRQKLELRNITYSYPGTAEPTLRNLNVTIHSGESVGFIGVSGAGKSTLVDIVLGLLTPDGGEVRVDGRDIREDLRSWQDQVGYVPQSIFLTDDTLRRNVAFGLSNDHIDDAAVWRAIRAAQLEEFVSSLSDGLNTLVGERGVRLSGGQRQRIGIARSLYHDPAVLVLDEATSALDTATERGVMEAVAALHGSKTILIVAHRLSSVERCDRLYRLRNGMAVDEGRATYALGRSS